MFREGALSHFPLDQTEPGGDEKRRTELSLHSYHVRPAPHRV